MLKKFLSHCKAPGQTWGGRSMLRSMNAGHGAMMARIIQLLPLHVNDYVLDVGCGGGELLRRLHQLTPEGLTFGIDLSPASVEMSKCWNEAAVAAGDMVVMEGSADELPFEDATFHVVTANETIYFWPGLVPCFQEVARVLKPGGYFAIGTARVDKAWLRAYVRPFERMIGFKAVPLSDICEALSAAGFEVSRVHQATFDVEILAQKMPASLETQAERAEV